MQFESFSEFLAMGKHGFYVWLVYGVAAMVLVANYISVQAGLRRVQRQQQWRAQADVVDTAESQSKVN